MATRYNYTGGIVTDGLVLHLDAAKRDSYPGSGTTWYNLVDRSITGTLTNGPTFSGVAKDAAIEFDGSNDYGAIPHSSLAYDRTAFSVEAVIKPRGVHSNYRQQAFGKWNTGSGTSNEFALGFGGGSSGLSPGAFTVQSTDSSGGSYGKGAYTAGGTTNYEVGTWMHIVGTFDNGSVKFYKNGVLEGVNEDWASSFPYAKTVTNLSFGIADFHETSNYSANASISQIRMYSGKALSADEISQNFNALRGRYGI